jgi:oligopeptide/dipeptide ABC transporter ATP-binding protein
VVEAGPTADVVRHSRHPYTRGLLESLPHPEAADQPLVPIRGTPPSPAERPVGCAFHPRCAFAIEACRREVPGLAELGASHRLACPVDPFAGAPELVA